jgi:hypothetical protein
MRRYHRLMDVTTPPEEAAQLAGEISREAAEAATSAHLDSDSAEYEDVDDDDGGNGSEADQEEAFFDARSRAGSLLSLLQPPQQQQQQQQQSQNRATAGGSGAAESEVAQPGAEGAVVEEPGPAAADTSILARLGRQLPVVGAFFGSLVPRETTPERQAVPPMATSTPMGNAGDGAGLVRRTSQRERKPRIPCEFSLSSIYIY